MKKNQTVGGHVKVCSENFARGAPRPINQNDRERFNLSIFKIYIVNFCLLDCLPLVGVSAIPPQEPGDMAPNASGSTDVDSGICNLGFCAIIGRAVPLLDLSS